MKRTGTGMLALAVIGLVLLARRPKGTLGWIQTADGSILAGLDGEPLELDDAGQVWAISDAGLVYQGSIAELQGLGGLGFFKKIKKKLKKFKKALPGKLKKVVKWSGKFAIPAAAWASAAFTGGATAPLATSLTASAIGKEVGKRKAKKARDKERKQEAAWAAQQAAEERAYAEQMAAAQAAAAQPAPAYESEEDPTGYDDAWSSDETDPTGYDAWSSDPTDPTGYDDASAEGDEYAYAGAETDDATSWE